MYGVYSYGTKAYAEITDVVSTLYQSASEVVTVTDTETHMAEKLFQEIVTVDDSAGEIEIELLFDESVAVTDFEMNILNGMDATWVPLSDQPITTWTPLPRN